MKRNHITGDVVNFGLQGGLGNQLFCVSTVLANSYEHNLIPFFRYNGESRSYSNDYTSTLFKKLTILNSQDVSGYHIVDENILSIPEKQDILLQGYFQSKKYFDKYRTEILSMLNIDFKEVEDTYNSLKGEKPLVGMHVRRGDYIHLNWNLPKEYYYRALEMYRNHECIIFTDDIEWCRCVFPDFKICSTGKDYIDLLVMSKMDSIIMSNSTFSWWGVYIGNIKNVVCPYPWLKNVDYNKDIYDDNWIKIDT